MIDQENTRLTTELNTLYERNNRSTGQKSLRCFPVCKGHPNPDGHVNGGFCGQSLKIHMLIASNDRPISISEYVFISEMRPSDKPNISALKTVNKTELINKVRTRQDKEIGVREIFMGEVEVLSSKDNKLELIITFNGRHQSWDYAWRSNRWTGDQHVVDIVALSYFSPTEYKVVDTWTSPEFRLMSSHKRNTPDEKVIHDKVRAKKCRLSDQMLKKHQTGPSTSDSIFIEDYDLTGDKGRIALHQGTDSDSEFIDHAMASYTLSRMSESAMHAFEDFDGGDLPLPTFMPGTNALVGIEYIPITLDSTVRAEDAVASTWNTVERSSVGAINHDHDEDSMIILPNQRSARQKRRFQEPNRDYDNDEEGEKGNVESRVDDPKVACDTLKST